MCSLPRCGSKTDAPNGEKESAMGRCKRCETTLLLHTISPFSLAPTHTRYTHEYTNTEDTQSMRTSISTHSGESLWFGWGYSEHCNKLYLLSKTLIEFSFRGHLHNSVFFSFFYLSFCCKGIQFTSVYDICHFYSFTGLQLFINQE